ncbi:epoxide hydrolase family protein [Actinoplanes friuliensis]|uniref:Epoxide hydrolase domain-containing protein n=1 Tax=Actinoplanes friuliensis DSM 7358 TaxID=1246995 RepID=U5W7I2_9ACTN|nr:epoxide hydrolase family protein [Actinoplanes friuliensis]AGZ44972.1 epoxide hydrolase domain-containing protein [Actinoplanes friuliensis DSM 7358]
MITPFELHLADDTITDLRDRLRRTRWPEPATVPGWTQGVPLDYLRDYWADGYNWRAFEARIGALPQFRTTIDGLGLHFVHARSANPDAVPLILTHGWPGSIVEFAEVVGPLTESFHVVCPSLPGYGFSDRPTGPGWTVERIARAWVVLMDRLGYPTFAAAGHDWGTSITTSMAQQDPDRLLGIHLLPPLVAPDPATFDTLTDAERSARNDLSAGESGDGYSHEMSTRPQTIGYALVDSPVALAAWILEKFEAWTDGEPISRDALIDNLMLYWLPATGASAARLYWESFAEVRDRFRVGTTDKITVPTGCSIFPRENPHPSRRWAEKRFKNIRYWNEPPRGGHFAAFEQPALFVSEVQACFRALLS